MGDGLKRLCPWLLAYIDGVWGLGSHRGSVRRAGTSVVNRWLHDSISKLIRS